MIHTAWLSAFIDLPAVGHSQGSAFWPRVTGFTPSEPRGDQGQYRRLAPADADVHLRIQRTEAAEPGIHLDVHVASVVDGAQRAVDLGAEVLNEVTSDGHFVVLRSPAGAVFCMVQHEGEHKKASPGGPGPLPVAVDQVSVDVPAAVYDAEVAFWAALTGFEARAGILDEFTVLPAADGLPLRLLLQRLGPDDGEGRGRGSGQARMHLDLAAGVNNADVARLHESLGAEIVARFDYWIVMRDPAGLVYCLTRRDPQTGLLPH